MVHVLQVQEIRLAVGGGQGGRKERSPGEPLERSVSMRGRSRGPREEDRRVEEFVGIGSGCW